MFSSVGKLASSLFLYDYRVRFWFMVVNATFNNISVISWRSVLFVKETEYPERTSDQC
jgi:hypothetical protein